MYNKAFTLAEVLITLAIIGVVAAITIPSIVANHQKRTLETQFAKVYRNIQHIMQLAQAEYGDFSNWEWKDSYTNEEMDNFVKKYFIPYMNVLKFCPANNSINGCINDEYKFLNGSPVALNYDMEERPSVLLADGTSLSFYFEPDALTNNSRTMGIDFDINGQKKPNQIGYDFHTISLYPKTGEILPNGLILNYNALSQTYIKHSAESIAKNCLSGSKSWGCTAKVVQDGFKINY